MANKEEYNYHAMIITRLLNYYADSEMEVSKN